jgi:hypothetical protein
VLPVVICAGAALTLVDDIPAGVIGVLVISLLLLNHMFVYAPKYEWDERYLTQADWIRGRTEKKDVLILSDSPPMTLYYAQRYGIRLNSVKDNKAWEQLQQVQGNYLVGLPTSQRIEFWDRVKKTYPMVGPGIYRLIPLDDKG